MFDGALTHGVLCRPGPVLCRPGRRLFRTLFERFRSGKRGRLANECVTARACPCFLLAHFSYLRADACGFGIGEADCFFTCAAGFIRFLFSCRPTRVLVRLLKLRADACGFGIDQVDCFFACAAGGQEGPRAGPSCQSPGPRRRRRGASFSSGLLIYPLGSNLPSVREALSNEG